MKFSEIFIGSSTGAETDLVYHRYIIKKYADTPSRLPALALIFGNIPIKFLFEKKKIVNIRAEILHQYAVLS